MVCQKITGINILGLICTQKMSVDGRTVDLSKCAMLPLATLMIAATAITLSTKRKGLRLDFKKLV